METNREIDLSRTVLEIETRAHRIETTLWGGPYEEDVYACQAATPINDEVNLWYNTRHPEALDWLKQIVNREKKVLDFAQTFAARNAAKHLHGIQKPPEQIGQNGSTIPVNEWNFTVLCWRPVGQNIIKWDTAQYEQLQYRVDRMINGENEFGGQAIEFKSGSEETEAGAYADPTALEPEDRPEPIETRSGEPEEGARKPEKAEAVTGPKMDPVANLKAIQKDSDLRPFYLEACETMGIEVDSNHSPNEAGMIVDTVSRAVEASEKEG